MNNIVIVTRHAGLIEFLIEEGHVPDNVPVLHHVSEKDIAGKDVWGVLPLNLASKARSITEVPLNLTAEMRGRELSCGDVRAIAGHPVTYIVRNAWDVPIEEQI